MMVLWAVALIAPVNPPRPHNPWASLGKLLTDLDLGMGWLLPESHALIIPQQGFKDSVLLLLTAHSVLICGLPISSLAPLLLQAP